LFGASGSGVGRFHEGLRGRFGFVATGFDLRHFGVGHLELSREAAQRQTVLIWYTRTRAHHKPCLSIFY
jgi:hypothetical protein